MTQHIDALICIDFCNEIVSEDGKLAAKGYGQFVTEHETLMNLKTNQERIRMTGGRVIFVNLGFDPDYADWPANSPLLGAAKGAGILQVGSNSSRVHEHVAPEENDIVLRKRRISAFRDTGLETVLKSMEARTIALAGVSTDLAVESAARDAHDLDFNVNVIADSCAAASASDHQKALETMAKFCTII